MPAQRVEENAAEKLWYPSYLHTHRHHAPLTDRQSLVPASPFPPKWARLRRQSCCCAIWGGHVKSDLPQLPFHFIVMIEITESLSPAALHSLEQFYPVIRPWDTRFLMKPLASVQVNLSHIHIVFSRVLLGARGLPDPYMIELLIRHKKDWISRKIESTTPSMSTYTSFIEKDFGSTYAIPISFEFEFKSPDSEK